MLNAKTANIKNEKVVTIEGGTLVELPIEKTEEKHPKRVLSKQPKFVRGGGSRKIHERGACAS